ncbi:MAG TPA: Gfo/Idh/MocA family oxidoreductase, partial [bacterium]|nr:Gfo/Idh/MocA family oxidoreductase [bacterium]
PLHASQIEQCMRAGKHVLCTKPLINDAAQASSLLRAANETGKRLQAETYARLGYLYYNHVYDKGAMDALVKAEEIDSNCGLIYYVWGRIRRDEGNLEEAASHFQKAWSLDPKLSAAQDYLMDTQKEISRQKEEQARWLASE